MSEADKHIQCLMIKDLFNYGGISGGYVIARFN